MVADNGCDPFETGVAIEHADIVLVGDRLDGFGGDDCLYDIFVACQTAEFGVTGHDVVEQDHHDLVAVDQNVFTFGVAEHTSDSVGIGVGSHDQVGLCLFRFRDCHGHC